MKAIIACMLTAGLTLTAVSSANAAEGCGPGGHRGPRGHCRSNGRPGPVVGNYYHGQGYWDGHRYSRNRYRHHDSRRDR